ncbi:hypothetical protein TNCV_2818911, partial [Trichonephila clavipes]
SKVEYLRLCGGKYFLAIGNLDDSEGSVLQDLRFVIVGFGRTTPDLACVGQYWAG